MDYVDEKQAAKEALVGVWTMRFIAIATALFIGLASPAWADAETDFHTGLGIYDATMWGEATQEDIDEGVAALSRAIPSGELSAEALSLAYQMRGDFYSLLGMRNSAISDYRKVIELNWSHEHVESATIGLLNLGTSP